MSYVKNVWQNGDVITAEKLNNLEDGVESSSGGNNAFLIGLTWYGGGEYGSTDKTVQEILDAFYSGKTCILKEERENGEALGTILAMTIGPLGCTAYAIWDNNYIMSGQAEGLNDFISFT